MLICLKGPQRRSAWLGFSPRMRNLEEQICKCGCFYCAEMLEPLCWAKLRLNDSVNENIQITERTGGMSGVLYIV